VSTADSNADTAVTTAFGAKNRMRLLQAYFAEVATRPVSAANAWQHVYRLLLWTDQTTGLAHCYESDKCQPGKRWYGRSLAFHDWLGRALGEAPAHVGEKIDWMFQRAAAQLAEEVVRSATALAAAGQKQRKAFEGRGFPEPGQDPELVAIIRDVLGSHFATDPTPAEWGHLIQRIRQYLLLDNKRKNLLGEGFEDVLGQVVARSCGDAKVAVQVRQTLHQLPGFNKQRAGDKDNKVDVAVLRPSMRTLVTAKWSVRADREKQFTTDFNDYVSAESSRRPFEYVFVTNEFDPARLVRACEALAGNAFMFAHVVHISTDALKATYGALDKARDKSHEDTMHRVLDHIESGRLLSLETWIQSLAAKPAVRRG